MYDVCIVGGGAAGLSCAITAARKGYKVCVLDQNKKIGKKLYATGNGKCNITNEYMDFEKCYHSKYKEYIPFLEAGIGMRPTLDVLDFFEKIGVACMEKNGYYYPVSQQASAVVWAMLDACKSLGVDIRENSVVHEIFSANQRGKNLYSIIVHDTKNNEKKDSQCIHAKNVVLSCGGKSYSKLGGTELGYNLARQLDISVTELRPCLCGVKVEEDFEAIKGVRVPANATLVLDDQNYMEAGELQITDYGLSGIMIFNLSSVLGQALKKKKKVELVIDFMQDVSLNAYFRGIEYMKHRTMQGFLNSYLNDKVAGYLLEKANINPKKLVKDVSSMEFGNLYRLCSKYKASVTGLNDYETAQVTAGGVSLEEIHPETFESKKYKGLYLVGEMLDIDGICGGYNITFAVLSGKKAGEQIVC